MDAHYQVMFCVYSLQRGTFLLMRHIFAHFVSASTKLNGTTIINIWTE